MLWHETHAGPPLRKRSRPVKSRCPREGEPVAAVGIVCAPAIWRTRTDMNQAANRVPVKRDIGLIAAELFYPDIIGVNSRLGQHRLQISVHLGRAGDVVYRSG